MTISTDKARELCTNEEFDMYLKSLPREVKKLSTSRLKQDVKLARKARDKYTDLSRKAVREGRKPGRTGQKEELFTEVLDRYEAALKASEAADAG